MAGIDGTRRLLAALAAAALAAAALIAAPAGAQQPATPPQVIERDMRGEEAIRALEDRLPAVAAQNEMTPKEFRDSLRADSMLWVGTTGRLLFVDEFGFGDDLVEGHARESDHEHEHAEADASPWTSAALPDDVDVFQLESLPNATRVIVLDFNGHDARGTAWGASTKQIAGPYDADGDPSSFSLFEQQQIYSVWQRVSEDFAPFNVNVTTKDFPHIAHGPGHPAIRRDHSTDEHYGTRVVITPSQTYSCRCGGVAYVGVFARIANEHDYYQPAWVFTAGVGNGAKHIAEAATHEAGHNLNLRHDGTSTTGYYRGHGAWAPIMGVGYYEPITQWSKGEYAGANNTEDDLLVMQMIEGTARRGIAPLVDDVVTPVDLGGGTGTDTTITRQHVIGSADDTDSFTFSTTGGTVTIDAAPAAVSPNLDLRVVLRQGTSTLAWADPPSAGPDGNDVAVGLGAAISTILPAGTYTAIVDGVGFGDPRSDGYSDYASVGRYTLRVRIANDGATGDGGGGGTDLDPSAPQAPTAPEAATQSNGSVTVTWEDNSNNETGFEVEREQQHKNGSWRGTTTLTADSGATSLTDAPGTGTFRYRIRAMNDLLASSYTNWVQVSVSGGDGGTGGGNKGGKKITAI